MSRQRTVSSELDPLLKELRLPAMRSMYREASATAEKESSTYEEYLLQLARSECASRHAHRVELLTRESRLPPEKTMLNFERQRLPRSVNAQLSTLLDGSFVDRRENVLLFGTPGSGKSHLLCALGHELVQQRRRVLMTRCSLLVQELLSAKQSLRLVKMLKHLSRAEVLIVDDIGYVQQNRDEMEVLFTLLAERYERGSVMLTSNVPFGQWEKIFKDPMMAAAAVDRLVHHSIIIEMNLPSYRLDHVKAALRNTIGMEEVNKKTEKILH
jgi:DNA replication protein DnaC